MRLLRKLGDEGKGRCEGVARVALQGNPARSRDALGAGAGPVGEQRQRRPGITRTGRIRKARMRMIRMRPKGFRRCGGALEEIVILSIRLD